MCDSWILGAAIPRPSLFLLFSKFGRSYRIEDIEMDILQPIEAMTACIHTMHLLAFSCKHYFTFIQRSLYSSVIYYLAALKGWFFCFKVLCPTNATFTIVRHVCHVMRDEELGGRCCGNPKGDLLKSKNRDWK